jgi:hypothetical protein
VSVAILAALASVPHRAHLLPRVLRSLRRQVDWLCVYLNESTDAPSCVKELADYYICDPVNSGAEAKLAWANHPSQPHPERVGDGFFYLSCDDDFVYPANYAETMRAAVEQWRGQAIVTAHGRTYVGRARGFFEVVPGSLGTIHRRVESGRWVNHAGSGVMAWDTRRVHIPSTWPERNATDAQVSVWAQKNRVPIWLVPHPAKWLNSLASSDPRGIFRTSQRDKHRTRNALISSVEWSLYKVEQ